METGEGARGEQNHWTVLARKDEDTLIEQSATLQLLY